MKIFGFQLSVKKQPGPGARLVVIEESLASHDQVLHSLYERLGVVEKKAEATRRKVYRDGEEPAPTDQPAQPAQPEAAPAPSLDNLGPGDPVPSGMNF